LRWALLCVRSYRARLIRLGLLSSAEIALRLMAPWTMAFVIDHALAGAPVTGAMQAAFDTVGLANEPTAILLAFVGLGLLLQAGHLLVVLLHGRRSAALGQDLIRDLRERQFSHAQALALSHHAMRPTGDSVQLVEADSRCIDQIVLRGVFPVVFSALTLVVMFGVLASVDLGLAVLSLAIIPPLYLWIRISSRRMAPSTDHARRADAHLSSRVVEAMSSIRLIKSHAREDHEQAKFADAAGDAARAWIRVGQQGASFAIGNGLLTAIGTALVLLAGGFAVIDSRLTVGTLLLVLSYLAYIYGPLSAIANTSNSLQQAFASARRIRSALAIAPEPIDQPGAIPAAQIRGEVRFEDVRFGYRPGTPVLDGVTFAARPGEVVALVGPSGAGKSTLASLLLRFYDPVGGAITIDGVSIDHFQLRSLRRQIGVVLQEAILRSGTIRQNLRYAREDATDAELERAARAAHAHDFIMRLPAGYDTELGEGGIGLSGGQRQRLSIARAFLADTPILILDEPTAALDTIAEQHVVDAMHALWTGRTTFVIAHRLSTVRRADRIVVLDHGRVVGEGTHDELRRDNLLYRQLCAQLAEPTSRGAAADRAPRDQQPPHLPAAGP
jgi:ATP-binding cassette subfamily B protein